ncbi:MAG: glycosyltransferase family 4 protein [Verrucomicrobiales bacterium]|nr:glycosyltransferase family 4 protein [Verrucomicrobiales bacterium]
MARALVAAGHAVRVVGVYPQSYPASDYEEDHGVRVWRIRESPQRLGWLVARHRLYRQVSHWARRREIELVEAPDSRGWFAGWPDIGVPLVQRANGSYTYFAFVLGRPLSRTTAGLERWSYQRADCWTAVSKYASEVTANVCRTRQGPRRILYNPVEIPPSPPPFQCRNKNSVVFSGTLTEKKGVVSLIDAWIRVRETSDGELHIYGKDSATSGRLSMKGFLLSRLPSALHASVSFHGHVTREELFNSLATARVAVFPSFAEAFALAPLEAMASACPVICSVCGAGPELLTDGVQGLLVDPAQPAKIAAAISAVLRDDSLALRLSVSGRAKVERDFALEKLLPSNESFFAEATHCRRGAPC